MVLMVSMGEEARWGLRDGIIRKRMVIGEILLDPEMWPLSGFYHACFIML